jgi:hypothetical protein
VDTDKKPKPSGAGTLNVILHGTFAFVQDTRARSILALVPALAHHACRAGSWLAETELFAHRDYELKGVKTGDGTFNPRRNLFVRFKQRPAKSRPRATLIFPFPKKVTSLRIADVPRDSFVNPRALVSTSATQHMATLQIFTYDFDDDNELLLTSDRGGHHWEPAFTRQSINLHIFSSEDHREGPSHAIEDFKECAMLLGSDLELGRSLRAREIPPLDVRNLPDGVVDKETEDLAPRTIRLARLGRILKQKDFDANVAWFGNDALDGDPQACSGPVGRG